MKTLFDDFDFMKDNDPLWKPIEKRLCIGLQYIGSKEMIASYLLNEIFNHKPRAKIFYDLFGGGGSMSFAAYESGLNVVYNELMLEVSNLIKYCIECAKNPICEFGIFDKEVYEFCDRKEFSKIKEKKENKEVLSGVELIKLFTYSFYCSGSAYFCSFEKEVHKKAGHSLVFCKLLDIDYKPYIKVFCDKFGQSFSNDSVTFNVLSEFCERKDLLKLGWIDRRKLFANIMLKLEAIAIANLNYIYKKYDFNELYNHKQSLLVDIINRKCPNIPKKQHYKRNDIKQLQQLQRLERLQQLQQLERLEQLQQLQQLQQLECIYFEVFNKTYKDFDFNENTHSKDDIIYCDIPYIRAGNMYGKDAFDYSEFLKWVDKQNENGFDIFISESDGFGEFSGLKPILRVQKQSSMTKKASGKKTSSIMNEYLFLSPAKQN